VYGHAVETVAADEGAAYGAALLAGVGVGVWSNVDEAVDATIRTGTTTAPDPDTVSVMNGRYAQYRQLYPALRAIADSAGADLAQRSSPAASRP
jgi:xylulokinase